MPFELIKSETLLQGRAFKVRRDYLKTPTGDETRLEIIEHGGSVVVVPIDDDGNLLLVRQYRHAAQQDLLELPAGTRDKEEPFEQCAAREIREETGMEAGKLKKVGKIPVRKAIELFQSDEMLDAKSLAAWLLARPHLEKYLG